MQPCRKALVAMKPIVHAKRSGGGRYQYPEEVRVSAATGRKQVGKKEAAVDQIGETKDVFTRTSLYLLQGASGVGCSWKCFEGGDGDSCHGARETLTSVVS
jgi:hypothetical protein